MYSIFQFIRFGPWILWITDQQLELHPTRMLVGPHSLSSPCIKPRTITPRVRRVKKALKPITIGRSRCRWFFLFVDFYKLLTLV